MHRNLPDCQTNGQVLHFGCDRMKTLTKLRWTDMTQHLSETALAVVGPDAPRQGKWSRQWLWSKAASIAGGTSEVQRTIIGERLLGLPREGSPR